MEEYAEKNRYPYIEVSAKNGSNIHLLFRKISEKLIEGKSGAAKEAADSSTKTEEKKEHGNISLKKEEVAADTEKKQCQC